MLQFLGPQMSLLGFSILIIIKFNSIEFLKKKDKKLFEDKQLGR